MDRDGKKVNSQLVFGSFGVMTTVDLQQLTLKSTFETANQMFLLLTLEKANDQINAMVQSSTVKLEGSYIIREQRIRYKLDIGSNYSSTGK